MSLAHDLRTVTGPVSEKLPVFVVFRAPDDGQSEQQAPNGVIVCYMSSCVRYETRYRNVLLHREAVETLWGNRLSLDNGRSVPRVESRTR